jgi:moderate conductance mechanosensitive channel
VEFTTTNGTVTGTVDAIGLRLTRVVDQYGRMVSIPNGSIVYVTNATRLPSRVTIKIQAPLRAAVGELRQRIADAAARSAPAAGVDPGSVAIWVDDASADAVTFSIEFEAVRATARAAEATVRESVLAALQGSGLLPGSPATPEGG